MQMFEVLYIGTAVFVALGFLSCCIIGGYVSTGASLTRAQKFENKSFIFN